MSVVKYLQCSLASPGNIPVVLSTASVLYQTRPGYQRQISLPLGIVVNAVFKIQQWVYVQTPHADQGYVLYEACLPLGILPTNRWVERFIIREISRFS